VHAAAYFSPTSASSIKIWIVLARIRQHAKPAIKPHQPSSAQCALAARKHSNTLSSCNPVAAFHLSQQPNKHKPAGVPSGWLASATWNMTCHPPSDLFNSLSPIETQNTNSVSCRPHLGLTFLVMEPAGRHLKACVAWHIYHIPSWTRFNFNEGLPPSLDISSLRTHQSATWCAHLCAGLQHGKTDNYNHCNVHGLGLIVSWLDEQASVTAC
jgi:hypothetical protein